ncbi:MAG: molybdopterin dehydrogenase FAD-binding, partial [Arthrobacter sp.]|nr:molybdopterin dehydrogenase FAD-binding [Arthrobacter sp.]
IHGLPAWRRDMTYRLAEEIRGELAAPAGALPGRDSALPLPVTGDFWPPERPAASTPTIPKKDSGA